MLVKVPDEKNVWLLVYPGDTLEWELVEKGGSGYLWTFHADNSGLVEIKTKRDMSRFTGIGGPVKLIASVRVLKVGKVKVTATHIRPFVGPQSAIDTRTLACDIERK